MDINWSYIAKQRDRYFQCSNFWQKVDCLTRVADEMGFPEWELNEIDEIGWTRPAIAKAERWFRDHESQLDAAKEADLRSLEAALAEGAL